MLIYKIKHLILFTVLSQKNSTLLIKNDRNLKQKKYTRFQNENKVFFYRAN